MRRVETFSMVTPISGRFCSNQRMWKAWAPNEEVSWNRSPPSAETVKSPSSLPLWLSIGVRAMRPVLGMHPAMIRSSQSRAPWPLTRYLPKLWISLMPTASRTARHSSPVGLNALERRKLGVSCRGSPSGAK